MKIIKVEFIAGNERCIFCNVIFSKRKHWFASERIEFTRRVMLECVIPEYCDTSKDVESRFWTVLRQEMILAYKQSLNK